MHFNVYVSDLANKQYDKFLMYIYDTLKNPQATDNLMQNYENAIG